MSWSRLTLIAVPGLVLGCSDPAVAPDLSVEADGDFAVGLRALVLDDAARGRALPTLLLYPTAAPTAEVAVEQLAAPAHRATYAGLLAAAPPACPTRSVKLAVDAAPAAGRFPLVVVSHCHECTGFSLATVAARLASHGAVVIAIEHVGNTLWDQRAGTGLPLDTDTLAVRVADVGFAIDQALGSAAVPAAITAAIDPDHLGVLGHSFGAVTAGRALQADPRIDAGFALAAPMQNPLLPGVVVAELTRPLGFLVAAEDNSITELGNQFIRDNYDAAGGAAYKIEVADAGHWSVSDVVGATAGFMAGCGAGTRQTDGQPFSYLDPATGRALSAAYVTAFFKATLMADAGAQAYLTAPRSDGRATVLGRGPR